MRLSLLAAIFALIAGGAAAQDYEIGNRPGAVICGLDQECMLAIEADAAQREAENQAKTDAKQVVQTRLTQACEAMYRRDPDATITNKLCFDVFWERGLPE